MGKFFRWILGTIFFVVFGFWLFLKYEQYTFLRDGILNIKSYPTGMNVLYHQSWGFVDEHDEYYFSLKSRNFRDLLQGRNFVRQDSLEKYFSNQVIGDKHSGFQPKFVYTFSYNDTQLYSNIYLYVNKDSTLVYVSYYN